MTLNDLELNGRISANKQAATNALLTRCFLCVAELIVTCTTTLWLTYKAYWPVVQTDLISVWCDGVELINEDNCRRGL